MKNENIPADIKSKFRQAFLTKLKLETNQEIKDDIINEVKRQVVFLATDFDILDEGRTDFNISFTELGGVKSLSSRICGYLLRMNELDNTEHTKLGYFLISFITSSKFLIRPGSPPNKLTLTLYSFRYPNVCLRKSISTVRFLISRV